MSHMIYFTTEWGLLQ